MLTITRICLAAGDTGGQNQNSQLPSGDPPPLPDMPSCSPPMSSTARTWKHGVIIGQYSPITQGNKIHREMAYHHGVMWWLKMELQFG